MTKKEKQMLDNYDRASGITELYQVYGRFSKRKAVALENCRELQKMYNGYDGRICTASAQQFTYGFKYVKDAKEYLYYRTASNDYKFVCQ